jgi:hypothetical protein
MQTTTRDELMKYLSSRMLGSNGSGRGVNGLDIFVYLLVIDRVGGVRETR